MPLTQETRSAAFYSDLPADSLVLLSLTGEETLGRPFRFQLELLSEDAVVDFTKVVGRRGAVRLTTNKEVSRHVHGIIARFRQLPPFDRYARYQAELVPWVWLLTHAADCRIFQDLTAPEIIEKVLQPYGGTYRLALDGRYRQREYCVQYRETDFQFISRMMEEEGIFYYFEHTETEHVLVLTDSAAASPACPEAATLAFQPEVKGSSLAGFVREWEAAMELRPGAYAHTDYNFQKPRNRLDTTYAGSLGLPADSFEVFDYPGMYAVTGEGDQLATVRLQELQCGWRSFRGRTDHRGLLPGYKIALESHPRSDQNQDYLLTSVQHEVSSAPPVSGGRWADELYRATFTATRLEDPFRSARTTPRPRISGPQTAFVVGPSGEEIYTDAFGRVKVLFPWDRANKADEKASCWVRVAHLWAGKGWGAFQLPRIGQEVIVEFLEGDPDRPIVTGRVYNAVNEPPYKLPDEKTKSTIKSSSSKGGEGFNEIRFEDKKGEEQIFVHAEKDEDRRTKKDCREWIGNERHLIVKKDQLELVEGDKHSTVKGDHVEKTEGNHGEAVKGDHMVAIDGGDHLAVKGDQNAKISGDASLKIGMNLNQEAGMKISVKSGMDLHAKAGMNYALDAGMAIHLKAGMTVVIEGGVQISLKAGPSFVDIGPAGVSISGPMVMINSGGAAGSGSGSSPTAPAAPEAPDAPKTPKAAAEEKPGKKEDVAEAGKPPKALTYSAPATVLKTAAKNGTPFCEKCEAARKEREAAAAG